jgi:putative ABC transport system permease protein
VAITTVWAQRADTPIAIPAGPTAVVIAAAALIGAVAGIYPAIRAARVDPATALTSV